MQADQPKRVFEGFADESYRHEPENRAAIVAFPDAGERDVLRQLAAVHRWDGNISSKSGRDSLCNKGLVERWNGYNFLTRDGFAVVDAIWGLRKFVKE